MITFSSAVYEVYTFPKWADALGVLIGIATLIPMPLFALYTIFVKKVVSYHVTYLFTRNTHLYVIMFAAIT